MCTVTGTWACARPCHRQQQLLIFILTWKKRPEKGELEVGELIRGPVAGHVGVLLPQFESEALILLTQMAISHQGCELERQRQGGRRRGSGAGPYLFAGLLKGLEGYYTARLARAVDEMLVKLGATSLAPVIRRLVSSTVGDTAWVRSDTCGIGMDIGAIFQ